MAKKQQAVGQALEVLEAQTADVVEVQTAKEAIVKFLAGMVPFFREAQALEARAGAVLAEAEALTEPTDEASDERVLIVVRKGNNVAKDILEKWDPITGLFNKVHKALTTGRGRGVKLAQEGAGIAQALHNSYKRKEERRAAEEQDRIRREQEAEAQAIRDAQLLELEQAALKAEADSPELSTREAEFVRQVMFGTPSDLAAKTAGFKDPFKAAARLLATEKIAQAIEAQRQAARIREQQAAKREEPLFVDVPAVKARVAKLPGGGDRDYLSAEITDAAAFIRAALEGKYGIPDGALMPNQTALNAYAREMGDLINRWPGVRLKTDTRSR